MFAEAKRREQGQKTSRTRSRRPQQSSNAFLRGQRENQLGTMKRWGNELWPIWPHLKRQRAFHESFTAADHETQGNHGPHYHAPQKKILYPRYLPQNALFHPSFYDDCHLFQLFQFCSRRNEATWR